jgi:hypothetical protein
MARRNTLADLRHRQMNGGLALINITAPGCVRAVVPTLYAQWDESMLWQCIGE